MLRKRPRSREVREAIAFARDILVTGSAAHKTRRWLTLTTHWMADCGCYGGLRGSVRFYGVGVCECAARKSIGSFAASRGERYSLRVHVASSVHEVISRVVERRAVFHDSRTGAALLR